jgi:hypothetical protein
VSNHGGRQLDHTQSTIEALPPIADAVAGRAEIMIDGGFNRGTDVIKALARGARVVACGRTMLWGLAADGADGVARVCEIMRDEIQINMGLCGRTKISELTHTRGQERAPQAPRAPHPGGAVVLRECVVTYEGPRRGPPSPRAPHPGGAVALRERVVTYGGTTKGFSKRRCSASVLVDQRSCRSPEAPGDDARAEES